MAISPAPIQTNPTNKETGLPALPWVQWFQQVVSALASMNQDGSLSVTPFLQVIAGSFPTSGAGLELVYASGSGTIQGYNRATNAWQPMVFAGQSFTFSTAATGPSANLRLTIDQSGNIIFANPAGLQFGSNYQTWTPGVTGTGSMTISGVSASVHSYCIVGPICFVQFAITFTTGGTPSSSVQVSLPANAVGTCYVQTNGFGTTGVATWIPLVASLTNGNNVLTVWAGGTDNQNFTNGSHIISGQFSYRIA